MNKILTILFLYFSVTALAQTDSISKLSVVSLENRHILYRGIDNPVKILVNNAKSFIATAPGLKKIDDDGNYKFNVTSVIGTTVTVDIDIVLDNGEQKKEQHLFEVRPIDFPYIKIGDIKFTSGTTVVLSEEELKTRFEFDMPVTQINKVTITGFQIDWHDKKSEIIDCGNTFTQEIIKKINSLKNGTKIKIYIRYYFKGAENYTVKYPYFYLFKYK